MSRHSDKGFQGTWETVTGADATLVDNVISNDRVSSVWLDHRCEEDV